MKRICLFVLTVLLAATFFLSDIRIQTNVLLENKIRLEKSIIVENYGRIPLAFTENLGQYDSQVKFTTSGSGAAMFFTQEGTTFLFHRRRISRPQRWIETRKNRYSGRAGIRHEL
ncbi:hypothetical protein AMJ80_07540 [bacterium SM23_31]|nr:MAG: hypothetical protein AMJ80_07540 [bacterium SM23_31]